MLALPEGTRFTVDAPLVRGRKGEFRDLFESLRGEGFTRVEVDGETYLLEEVPALDKKFKHDISVVVDRLVIKDDLRRRLTDSIETALSSATVSSRSRGRRAGRTPTRRASPAPCTASRCAELAPRMFSFNSPHGACPGCTGSARRSRSTPSSSLPDAALSSPRARWNVPGNRGGDRTA